MSPGRLQYDTNEAKIAHGNGRTYSKKPLIHPIHAHMCVRVCYGRSIYDQSRRPLMQNNSDKARWTQEAVKDRGDTWMS